MARGDGRPSGEAGPPQEARARLRLPGHQHLLQLVEPRIEVHTQRAELIPELLLLALQLQRASQL
jgi:hypothetical protein